MTIIQQVLFVITLGIAGFFVFKRASSIRRNILLGKDAEFNDQKGKRWGTMFRVAFGQQKMFDRPFVGFMHFLIYAGFLLINIEMLEIILDGILGTHRLFVPVLGDVYPFLINFFECAAIGVVLACVVFLLRRNVARIKRFHKDEMKGWPTSDANIILVWEIVLMFFLYTMNATDYLLQEAGDAHYPVVGSFAISQYLVPLYSGLSPEALVMVERSAWWVHIIGILGFAVYITYSKHLHIALAFPNTYFSRLEPRGKMKNMESVTNEVKIMMGAPAEDSGEEVGTFGAKDVKDLQWNQIMSAYSCTECGRCTSECPANLTGKKLSPRKVMMDIRDRAEEVGKNIDQHGADHDDGKSLYGDYISKEELMACTSCNACADACPINIDPLSIILDMRRYVAMEEASTPASWNAMFQNVENSQAPWAFPAADRFKWAEEISNSVDSQQ
ncbi:(Fe-S)-binding protein [Sediminitomix flava]|uniref:(Fe-S)-binding protein n=1 Tax=Sediminitomix flava TaxID=379075 RepID=UPI000D6D0A27|nr:(Fe-S)-binding protein [Sediminitomix flava]